MNDTLAQQIVNELRNISATLRTIVVELAKVNDAKK
jgi:hypothetical protein